MGRYVNSGKVLTARTDLEFLDSRNASAEATDYHLMYEQGDFVASLGATRRRQAARLLDALAALPAPPRSVFDFGCGRGFFQRGSGASEGEGETSQLGRYVNSGKVLTARTDLEFLDSLKRRPKAHNADRRQSGAPSCANAPCDVGRGALPDK